MFDPFPPGRPLLDDAAQERGEESAKLGKAASTQPDCSMT